MREDRKMLTVVQDNAIIEGCYGLSLNELRLLSLACTRIDAKRDSRKSITINVTEFKQAFGISSGDIYPQLRQAVKGLMRKPVVLTERETGKVRELAWLSENEYLTSDNGTQIHLMFSDAISPYLYKLDQYFTALDFEYAARLNTPFSFRLYQWLYLEKKFQKSRVGGTTQLDLSISEMKERASIKGYARWGDFKDKVIDPAVTKINANTDISVIYKPIRTGRQVTHVQFNYVIEDATVAKPLRPRLFRRPKVVKGSAAEGDWMRKNLNLLLDYEQQLKQYDSTEKLHLDDLRRMLQYASIEAPELRDRIQKEINQRTRKSEVLKAA